ncbi:hypothetical protein [Streptomyces kaniharaensis]|uniref:hypothetical protein n=1 Tax=Streptomyces kaniharaensis TaxID=212423 RepID=UPI001E5E0A64|nr:hypothetical protein [Streptomyces kaniharaensis]
MSSPPAAPAHRWPLILLRVTATTLAVLTLLQTVLAASFLNGTYESLRDHADNATTLAAAVLLQLAAAVLVRWPGRGPLWPLWTTAALAAAVTGQIVAAYTRALGVHITLGVLLVSAVLFGLVGAWRVPLPACADSPSGPDGHGRLPRPGGPVEVAK